MKPLEMQPTFAVDLPFEAEQAMVEIRKALKHPELEGRVVSVGRCIDYSVASEQQRFWSPHLSVQIHEEKSGSQLFARFSPRPEIWTMVMFVYSFAAFSIFSAAIYAYVQWWLGWSLWALLVIPIGIAIIVALHTASLMGQRLSVDQMKELHDRLDLTLKIAFPGESTQE